IKVECNNVAAVAGFTEERNIEKRAGGEAAAGGRPAVDGFPFQIEETAETSQRLSYIQGNVLPFSGGLSPERSQRNAPCRHAKRRHGAETKLAWENRIVSIESNFAAAIGSRHTDVRKDLIYALVQVEI